MEKPSVILRHDTAYFIGGFMALITAISFVLSRVLPADPSSRSLSLVITILMTVFCCACFFWGGCTETLDENGILIKRPFYSKRYPWSDVVKVSVVVVQEYKSKGPKFFVRIKNRKLPLDIDYTKLSMACITYYYGQPDEDKWGKPPTLM